MARALSRPIFTKVWADKRFRQLTIAEKLLYIYLRANNNFEQLAIYEIPIDYIAFETGILEEELKKMMDKFENELGLIKYSYDTEEVVILDYLEWGIIANKLSGTAFINCFSNLNAKVKNKDLLLALYNRSITYDSTNELFYKALDMIKDFLIEQGYEVQEKHTQSLIEPPKKIEKEIVSPTNDEINPLEGYVPEYKIENGMKYCKGEDGMWYNLTSEEYNATYGF